MSEVWARWRIALVPLGIALAIIGATLAITWGGPQSESTSSGTSTGALAASGPHRLVLPTAALPSSAAPGAPGAPAVPTTPPGTATPPAAGGPIGSTVTTSIVAAASPEHRQSLIEQRKEAKKVLEGFEDSLKRSTSEARELEKSGQTTEAATKRDEARRLKRMIDNARRTVTNLDEELGDPGG